jgi:uracil-DNA glycosylase family 4
MSFDPDRIISNAQTGSGPCNGCPAHRIHRGTNVNPGLLNPDADLMVLTMDPSHEIQWDQYADWAEYNQTFSEQFATWRGGEKIRELIEPLGLTLADVWLGDTIKCPVDNARYRFDDSKQIERAFRHCQTYLEEEITAIDPQVIVGLGEDATRRVLELAFDIKVGDIKTGTTDCGRVFDTQPPVIASPHWSHGWLDRSPTGRRNLNIVQDALIETYQEQV